MINMFSNRFEDVSYLGPMPPGHVSRPDAPDAILCNEYFVPSLDHVGHDTLHGSMASGGEGQAHGVLGLEHVPRALAARDTRGLIKLIADKQSKKLLGAHIIAPEGADSIQTAAMALKMGMSYEDLGATIFPYLTTVEGLKLAAQTFEKDVAKLSCCAG